MSIIQKIREKAAAIVFGAIAVSLIAFLLQDAFVGKGGRSGILSSLKDKIGTINGSGVEYKTFNERVNYYEELQKRNGQPITDENRQQLYDGVWEEFVTNKILEPVYNDLGITVTTKEVNDLLYGANPPQFMRQLFSDPNTGQYNAAGARDLIKNLHTRKGIDPFYISYIENNIDQLTNGGKERKYMALLSGAAYYPKWLADKENADNSAQATISFVNVPYTSIADSTIKISDDEITTYVNKHKEEFKQEKGVDLSYVVFSAAPTAADTQKLLSSMNVLKPKFAEDTSAESFLSLNNSDQSFFDSYIGKSKLQVPNKDSILALSKNGVFGPYLDADHYVIAKMIDQKSMPDSVICRHILISAQSTPDSIGKKRIDSIADAINKGASFVKLMQQYSDDEASKTQDSLGRMRFGTDQIQNPQGFDQDFAKFILYDGTAGQRKVVKTKFGWHLIEILEQKNFEPFYKIAYFSQKIEPSNETVSKANAEATAFATESTNVKSFEENAKKKNLVASPVFVKETDYSIPGLGYGRKLVKWAFENDKGDVSEPETFGYNYVVAVIDGKKEEGTQDAKTARPLVEPTLRNQKKADQIIKQIGNNTDISAIASANKTSVLLADSVSFQSSFIPNAGPELKVIGAIFNKQNLNKVTAPIPGVSGVFLVKVDRVFTKPNAAADYSTLRQQMESSLKNVLAYRSIETLRKEATIKDKRIKFY